MKLHSKIYLPFKRIIAIIGSIFGILIMFSLFWWWIIIINSFSTKGHPFFAQERIGKNGKPFKLLKFRSMYYGVKSNLSSEEANLNEMVTKFGKFLRKTSLDETIQLINIFTGKMAFIGPRPLIYESYDKITIDERKLNGSIKLRPGLGGYAQVNGRVNVSPKRKGELDGYYYEHLSFHLDLWLFLKTIFVVFKKENTEKTK